MKLYYCHIKDINISYLEIINNLVENPIDKPANKKILILFDYLDFKRP